MDPNLVFAEPQFDAEVDARHLHCPLPILRCKKALNALAASQTLKITATDAGAKKDFDTFCKQTGHTLLALHEQGEELTFWIQKRSS